MYRTLLPILLYVGVAAAAPPESNITYVKLSPTLDPEPVTVEVPGSEETVEPVADAGEESYEALSTTVAEDLTEETEAYTTTEPTTTKRPKRYRSKAKSYYSKLSYFQKSTQIPAASVNHLEGTSGKRGFVSKCRCEKIWNCPKLQITVPRCPDEYFLCCF